MGRHGLPVDGYDLERQTAYQYQGCYWYGYECQGDTTNVVNDGIA